MPNNIFYSSIDNCFDLHKSFPNGKFTTKEYNGITYVINSVEVIKDYPYDGEETAQLIIFDQPIRC